MFLLTQFTLHEYRKQLKQLQLDLYLYKYSSYITNNINYCKYLCFWENRAPVPLYSNYTFSDTFLILRLPDIYEFQVK